MPILVAKNMNKYKVEEMGSRQYKYANSITKVVMQKLEQEVCSFKHLRDYF